MSEIESHNPATGEKIESLTATAPSSLAAVFERGRGAQKIWAQLSVKKRAKQLLLLREALIRNTDSLIELISAENGKPRFESLASEILPCLEALTFYAKCAPSVLADRKIKMGLMKHRSSYLNYWPVGTVVVIAPWNYPFLLPFIEIAMAVVTGNNVIFKPSEVTPVVGKKIQSLFEESGFPIDLVQTVIGDGTLGSALIDQRPGKIFFTGSVSTGKKIMAAAAEHLIPVNLELGGKDAMIILADANLDYASSAAAWGGFTNAGQACASVERIIVHESIAELFKTKLKLKLEKLRHGPSVLLQNDLGPITLEKQKLTYESQLAQAQAQGAEISGGKFMADRRYLEPTIVSGPAVESLKIYNEESFGPIVAITTFRTPAEAIRKANASSYGLLASVITREQIARQLEVGTVTINEVLYTAGLSETPWGGVKDSGIGRTHSATGLLEFCHVRHIHKPKSHLLVFKSPWWFPYTPYQYETFRKLVEIYRRHWTDKLKALPHLLWNLVKFLKEEKRL